MSPQCLLSGSGTDGDQQSCTLIGLNLKRDIGVKCKDARTALHTRRRQHSHAQGMQAGFHFQMCIPAIPSTTCVILNTNSGDGSAMASASPPLPTTQVATGAVPCMKTLSLSKPTSEPRPPPSGTGAQEPRQPSRPACRNPDSPPDRRAGTQTPPPQISVLSAQMSRWAFDDGGPEQRWWDVVPSG